MKARVWLHPTCIEFGGKNEYPHGWTGTVMGSLNSERLFYMRFSQPFIGKNHKGDPTRKTDKQNGMYIPEWMVSYVR